MATSLNQQLETQKFLLNLYTNLYNTLYIQDLKCNLCPKKDMKNNEDLLSHTMEEHQILYDSMQYNIELSCSEIKKTYNFDNNLELCIKNLEKFINLNILEIKSNDQRELHNTLRSILEYLINILVEKYDVIESNEKNKLTIDEFLLILKNKTEKASLLNNFCNFKNLYYEITFLGDSTYFNIGKANLMILYFRLTIYDFKIIHEEKIMKERINVGLNNKRKRENYNENHCKNKQKNTDKLNLNNYSHNYTNNYPNKRRVIDNSNYMDNRRVVNNSKENYRDQYDPDKMKTRLCLKYMRHGTCRYADSCTFAHGRHELKKPNSQCKYYYSKDGCNSRNCKYSH